MNAAERFAEWLAKIPAEDPLHEELLSLEGKEAEISERFYDEIAFGTAGLRGVYGAGTMRMNAYTIGRATQGIADYILGSGEDVSRGVVLAFDCRYHSQEFAQMAAEIFAGNGIPACLFPSLRATPELSFAIRKLHALSGINMTASHNPKEYNGYKVYWSDGAQISGAVGDGMSAAIGSLDFFGEVRRMDLAEAVEKGLVKMLAKETAEDAAFSQGGEMDAAYLDYVLGLSLREDAALDRTVPIVYTPMHGAGIKPMKEVLARRGFTNVSYVEAQCVPDPEFSTVGYPNPEDPKAFAMAEQLGKEKNAAVLIATDPDADRMAVEIREKDGSYRFLNGNQTGALLIAYMAESKKLNGSLPEKAAMVKSIVTGELGKAICERYGIRTFEALTGFKNICGRIPGLEKEGYTCFFAYEESIGCAPDPGVRDKDGIAAGMLIAEMTAYYAKQGLTVADALDALYKEYGYYAEDQVSLILEGIPGQERIARIMEHFRNRYGSAAGTEKQDGEGLCALGLTRVIDYRDGYEDIPASNVLRFFFDDGSWFAMRPSGTEPKLKFYYYAVRADEAAAQERLGAIRAAAAAEADGVD